MSTLYVFVDFDNVEQNLKSAGPVACARTILTLVSKSLLGRHDEVVVRLYGGWRSGGGLTNSAQRLIPDIRASSPTTFAVLVDGVVCNLRLIVELADRPLGRPTILSESYVKDRNLRKFRARPKPWINCAGSQCGFQLFAGTSSNDICPVPNCSVKLVDIFVRDEQKMVDTLMVADIAKAALVDGCTDIVIVSSDTDMWPGLLLAMNAGCYVTHVHTKQGWRTQRHLMDTIQGSLGRFYTSTSP